MASAKLGSAPAKVSLMKSRLPRAARKYLDQLRLELGHLNAEERNRIIEQTNAKIRQLPGRGRNQVELFEQLGTAAMRAEKFRRTEPEALAVRSGKEFLNRILGWPIVAFALLTAVVLYFGPIATVESDGTVSAETMLSTWEASVGAQIIWLAILPVVLSALRLWMQNKFTWILSILGALLFTLVVIAGAAGIGLYFVPVTVLLWAQVLTPVIMMRGSMAHPGPLWLIAGALLVLLGLVWAVRPALDEITSSIWLIITPAIVLGLLAVLLPTRKFWVQIALITAGLLVIAAGLALAFGNLGHLDLIDSWVVGGLAFAVGHLALAGGLWHERVRKLLALY